MAVKQWMAIVSFREQLFAIIEVIGFDSFCLSSVGGYPILLFELL
jgi:hypothetical protein